MIPDVPLGAALTGNDPGGSSPVVSAHDAHIAGSCDAGQVVFNMNVGGGQSIFAQTSSRVNEVDAELRDKHTGKPPEDIKPLAILALRRIGVSLSDAELVAYADAVSRGEKYQFHLS
jgi:hypothetical protein